MTWDTAAYGAGVSTPAPHPKTLWEEGRHPGRLVTGASAAALLVLTLLDLAIFGTLNLFFDAAFVVVCVVAALTVRPRDFFAIGVLPPLLMAGTASLLAIVARSAVADPRDGFLQAVVSGLAHHAGALVVGYALTLGILALRQVATRHAGTIRTRSPRIPSQRRASQERAPH